MRASEFITEDNETGVSNYAVVYGGRFQPPHSGHYAVYKFLTNIFNPNNVFIATSNKTDKEAIDTYNKNLELYNTRYKLWVEKKSKAEEKGTKIPPEPKKPNPLKEVKSFFNYEEKKSIWTKLFGVPDNKVIFSAVPAFQPKELFSKLPVDTAYIAITSEKDSDRYTHSDYFEKYPEEGGKPVDFNTIKDKLLPFEEKGYYMVLPSLEGGISASEVRQKMQDDNITIEAKKTFLSKIYKSKNNELFDMIISRLGGNW